MSNLIPVACSLRTAVPGAIVRPHKYGNCCEKEGQLLSVGVVYLLPEGDLWYSQPAVYSSSPMLPVSGSMNIVARSANISSETGSGI